MKPKSAACASLAMICLSAALTGCSLVSSAPKASPQIYQPRVLRLEARQPIWTRDGLYLPQVDEVWHSATAYEDLETKLLNTAAAYAQERARHAP